MRLREQQPVQLSRQCSSRQQGLTAPLVSQLQSLLHARAQVQAPLTPSLRAGVWTRHRAVPRQLPSVQWVVRALQPLLSQHSCRLTLTTVTHERLQRLVCRQTTVQALLRWHWH